MITSVQELSLTVSAQYAQFVLMFLERMKDQLLLMSNFLIFSCIDLGNDVTRLEIEKLVE